ncbi:MAG: restriction endonuclease subunit S [Bacillota bacterium]|jgi:type I restriction enzyme S subunit|nr:restriction endonuclease subunit S [Bacillota bacterium]
MAREQKKENKELTPEERLQQALVPEEEWPYELPEGWKWVRIGGISELYNGRAFKPTDWSNEGLPIVRIQNLNDREAEYNHYAGEVDEQYALHGGELLFAWSGTPGTSFGAHIWWGKEAVLNQHIFKMEFDENLLNKRYFMHAINQQLNKLISVAHGGAGLQHVTKGVFENTAIPLPDLATQESLVSFIDKQCARLDEVSEEIESVLDSSEKRKQSILYKAMTGDLSERWRKENGYSLEEWDRRSVNDICRDIKVGIVIKPTRYYTDSSGIPAFRSANVREFHVQDSDWVYINEQGQRENQRTIVHTNDVLIVRSGNPGTACVVPEKFDGCNAIDIIIAVPDQSVIDPDYLCIFTNSPIGHGQIKSGVRGMALTHFNVTSYGKLEIAVPSLAEQHEIVHLVKQYLEKEKTVEETAMSVLNQLETTRQAILNKAFRGELVC